MSFASIRASLLFTLGVAASEPVPASAAQDACDALNRALQTLWLGGEDYFTREKITIPVNPAQDTVTLPPAVQTVLGPVRNLADGRSLRLLSDRGEWELYAQLFQPTGSSIALAPGPPQAYFIERLRNADVSNPVTIILLLRPAAAAFTTLETEVIRRVPLYSVASFALGANPVPPQPPVPDQYVETLLLPIARSFLIPSRYFTETTKIDLLLADAQRALVQLGLADPQLRSTRQRTAAPPPARP